MNMNSSTLSHLIHAIVGYQGIAEDSQCTYRKQQNDSKMTSKRIKLVHIMQKYDWDCGIACIRMILPELLGDEHFDESAIYGALLKTLHIGECIWTIDLVTILRHLSIDCVYYTITCGVDPGYKNEKYYEREFEAEEIRVNKLFNEASESGLVIIQRSLTMTDILRKFDDGYVGIALVDLSVFQCNCCSNFPTDDINLQSNSNDHSSRQYTGHYIIVCGYDEVRQVVFCKNPSHCEEECCVNMCVFDVARKSYGTDEDLVFVKIT